jgi:hypothetical protein
MAAYYTRNETVLLLLIQEWVSYVEGDMVRQSQPLLECLLFFQM